MLDRRRLGRQIVIYTRSHGIFIGSAIGLGFWSKLDSIGQGKAVTFQSVHEAKLFVSSWETKPPGIQYKQVRADIIEKDGTQYASIEACFRAGLPVWDPWLPDRYITPRRRKRLSNKREK